MIIGNPLLLGGGGAPDLNGSTIRVTANLGATVTVRKGTLKYQKIVSSPTEDFVVKYSGRWTVTAEKIGETTKTEYVDVLSDNTIYPISMTFRTYFVKNGVKILNYTTAGKKKASSSTSWTAKAPTVTDNPFSISMSSNISMGIVYFSTQNLTGVNRVVITGTLVNKPDNDDGRLYLRVWTSIGAYADDNVVADLTWVGTRYSVELDVSNLTGNHYIGFYINRYDGSQYGRADITDMYIE